MARKRQQEDVTMPYTVTRQIQWPEGTPVVEVSRGGPDYTNPDALVEKYPGEFKTFEDPREAVNTAIEICRQWRLDGQRKARVGVGCTMGMTLPFDPIAFRKARRWADKEYQQIAKCDRCGAVLPQEYYTVPCREDERFCREYCAEKAAQEVA